MLKKSNLFSYSCIVLSSLITINAYANAATYPYVGASIGVTANTATNLFGSYRGVPLSVFAGYGGVIFQNFYLAAELTGTLGTPEISNQGAVKTSYGYGASILPGVVLCDRTILFGRLGIVRTHFPQVKVPYYSTTADSTGGQFGLGMQTEITQDIDIRGEYDFIAYRSISASIYSANPRSDVATLSLIYKFA